VAWGGALSDRFESPPQAPSQGGEASPARRLRDLVEPIAGCVYFAPEAHAAFEQLGLGYLPGYFCSRSAPLGKAPAEVVAAVFAGFEPAMVARSLREGWARTDPEAVLEARMQAAQLALRRLLGDDPGALGRPTEIMRQATAEAPAEGRPLFAALRALPWPTDSHGSLWRAADLVREHRGDSHTMAWAARGFDGCEIALLTEAWYGLPPRTFVRTRGFSSDQIDAAQARLAARGLMDDTGAITDEGRRVRDAIEDATDLAEQPLLDAIHDRFDELCALLEPIAAAVRDGGGYPVPEQTLERPPRATH
jgi:hypothetical protein